MTGVRPRRAVLTLTAALTLGVLASACTSSDSGAARTPADRTSTPVSAASTASDPATEAESAPTSEPASQPASAQPESTSPRRSPIPSATATAASSVGDTAPSPSTCRTVTVRVILGGALPGAEIAALQFTNAGTTPCALGGFPIVTLLRDGRPVGSVSESNGRPAKTVQLAPGETAESQLRVFSSCQAPLSDNLRVTVPGESTSAARPARLRACTLRVAPLGPPS